MAERHTISLQVSQSFANAVGWIENRARVARDLEQLARAVLELFQGHPSWPRVVILGDESFSINSGPIFENFKKESAAGVPWKAWSPAWKATRQDIARGKGQLVKGGKRKGQIKRGALRKLYLTGLLEREATNIQNVSVQLTGSRLILRIVIPKSKVPYAAVQDQGGTFTRPAIFPVNAKVLRWMWWVRGGKLTKGPFFSMGVKACQITIPARPYLVIGTPIPRKWAAIIERYFKAWIRGIFSGSSGNASATSFGYKVISNAS